MKKLFTLLFVTCVAFVSMAQTVTGKVVDADNGEALIGASVAVKGSTVGTITDIDGTFSINLDGQANKMIEVSYLGYSSKMIDAMNGGDLGMISLAPSMAGLEEVVITGVMDIVRDRRTPVAVSTISNSEIQAKSVGNVEFPEVMKNTPSVYVSNQTGFGDSQMFTRGFSQINTAFLLNGQPINGMEDGRMYWSNWSGMSDVAAAVQIQRGLGSSKLAISSVGGTVNIVTKTVENEQGGFARMMVGNDAYLKGTLAYSSGLQGKWAYSILVDHWQADNKWAEGTKGSGQNYFLSVGFQPNENHTFNFLVTGAPQSHGQRWSQSEETLSETPKFNQHWGYDNGDWKSERFNYYHKPVLNLNWDWDINNTSSLSSVLYASFGRGGGTGNYGRKRVRTDAGQVDWDAITAANTADSDGIGSFNDNYARRASINNHQWFGNVTTYETSLTDAVNWSVGADFRFYTGDHFRQLVDLFGLNGWQDSFRHATRGSDYVVTETFDANPWAALSNFASEDQRIAYDYSEDINYQGLFTQLEYASGDFSVFTQAAASNQSYQRNGRWADQGQSEKVSKIGYNIKGGASYSIDLSNTVFVNAGYYSRQPFLDNIFENVRYSNDLISPEVDNEEVVGLEAGYKFFKENFGANVNVYRTTWENRTQSATFTNDNGTPDNEEDDYNQRNIERGIGQVHTGVELDLFYDIEKLRVKGYASIGDWKYKSIDRLTVFNDDTGVQISDESGLDISEVHIPNAPQTSLGIGARYEVLEGLSLDADFNFYDNLYRRDNFDADDNVLREDIGTLPSYSIIDAGVSYKFMLGGNELQWRANVYNLFDKDYLNQTDPYGVLNGNGRTWNTSLKFNF